MDQIVTIVLPFFAVIFAGFAAGRIGFLTPAATAGLGRFAFYFALPALIFIKVYQAPVAELLNPAFAIRYEIATLVTFAIAAIVGRLILNITNKEAGMLGLNGAYANFGYLGLPLVLAAFGERAAIPAVMIFILDNTLLVGSAVAVVKISDRQADTGIFRALAEVFWGLVRNPLIITAVAAVTVAAIGFDAPPAVLNLANLLAGGAAPCALFALGASLANQPTRRGAAAEMSFITPIKLVVHPTLVGAALVGAPGVDPVFAAVAVVCAACPVAANVFVLAEHYGVYVVRTSTAILITTGLSVVTLTLFLVLFTG